MRTTNKYLLALGILLGGALLAAPFRKQPAASRPGSGLPSSELTLLAREQPATHLDTNELAPHGYPAGQLGASASTLENSASTLDPNEAVLASVAPPFAPEEPFGEPENSDPAAVSRPLRRSEAARAEPPRMAASFREAVRKTGLDSLGENAWPPAPSAESPRSRRPLPTSDRLVRLSDERLEPLPTRGTLVPAKPPVARRTVAPLGQIPVGSSSPAAKPRSAGPATPAAAPGADRWRHHRIVDGDSLPSLAQRYLGSSERAVEIFSANQDVLQDPDLLPIGLTLRIPDG